MPWIRVITKNNIVVCGRGTGHYRFYINFVLDHEHAVCPLAQDQTVWRPLTSTGSNSALRSDFAWIGVTDAAFVVRAPQGKGGVTEAEWPSRPGPRYLR